jgi:hypothetical protein
MNDNNDFDALSIRAIAARAEYLSAVSGFAISSSWIASLFARRHAVWNLNLSSILSAPDTPFLLEVARVILAEQTEKVA